jgi:tetratricopeptide (TPR) repeat protein
MLERAIEITPNDVAMRFQLGTLAVERGNLTLAVDQFQRCTVIAPDFADAYAHWSALETQRGDVAAAERILATGLRNCPQSPGLHLMRARDLRKAGRTEEALNEFMISARLRPNEPDAYIELGNTLVGLNRVEEGVEQWKAALNAEPEHPGALSILAFYAITSGNQPEADRWLARIAAQPRVTKDRLTQLSAAYRKQFGQDYRWKQPQ